MRAPILTTTPTLNSLIQGVYSDNGDHAHQKFYELISYLQEGSVTMEEADSLVMTNDNGIVRLLEDLDPVASELLRTTVGQVVVQAAILEIEYQLSGECYYDSDEYSE